MSRIQNALVWHLPALFLLTLGLNSAAALEIGQRVAVIEDQAPIQSGHTTIDLVDRGEVFTVLNTKESFLLVSRGHAGWIEARQVLPIEQAVDVLNAAAARRPADARTRAARAHLAGNRPR